MRPMQRKMQFVAYEMAAILQNMAEQKQETLITANDVASAARIAYLSIFFGNTMNSNHSAGNFPLGYFPYVAMYLLKGIGGNSIKRLWDFRYHGGCTYYVGQSGGRNEACALVNMNATTDSAFYKGLEINNDELKLVLDCCLYYYWDTTAQFADGRLCKDVPTRKAFGFLFINPKGVGSEKRGFFSAVATLSPIAGAFSENARPR